LQLMFTHLAKHLLGVTPLGVEARLGHSHKELRTVGAVAHVDPSRGGPSPKVDCTEGPRTPPPAAPPPWRGFVWAL
jgi:hypothetical protein